MNGTAHLKVLITQNGYAFIPQYHPSSSGANAAQTLGTLLNLTEGLNHTLLTPKEKSSSPPNTYSGIYGVMSFPFHTDLAHWRAPPRFFALRCVIGFKEVPTPLMDGKLVIGIAGRELLQRALVRPRRPIRGKLPLLRLLQTKNDQDVLRWDREFLRPASAVGEDGMDSLRNALTKIDPVSVTLDNPGDTLVIDNWRMLHARAHVPAECMARQIERTYLEDLH